MLTDDQFDEIALDVMGFAVLDKQQNEVAFELMRKAEAAATAPLLARIAELEAKLAQQDAEPVGVVDETWSPWPAERNAIRVVEWANGESPPVGTWLYTHSAPKAQPLTQDQIECGASALADSLNSAGYWLRCRGQEKAMYIAHAKATIEAALGVKLEGEAK